MYGLCTTIHVFESHESKKRGLDLLKMEVQTVVRHQVGAGNEPRSSGRVTGVFNH